jgi:hypothetical protein
LDVSALIESAVRTDSARDAVTEVGILNARVGKVVQESLANI